MEPDPSPRAWPTLPPAVPEETPPALPPEAHAPPHEEERHYQRRRQRHGHGTHFRRGRMWLVAIFCALRMVDAIIYMFVNANPFPIDKGVTHAVVITTGIWTTTLLVCIWLRHAWARYLLIVMIAADAFRYEILWIPDSLREAPSSEGTWLLISMAALHIGVTYVLAVVPSVQRLTNRSYN